jgi:hypothetical protein
MNGWNMENGVGYAATDGLERPIGQIDYSWIGCTDLMGGFD